MKHRTVPIFVPHLACPRRCSFCDQRAISGAAEAPGPEEVARLLRGAAEALGDSRAEIAFFGGSFTAVEPEYMLSLLRAAQPFLHSGRFTGIRVSTRPDAVGREILDVLAAHGVDTVELGAQCLDDAVLKRNRRGHTAADVAAAAARVREAGMKLGLQMMTGLFGDTDRGAVQTARGLAAMRPDFVRIYPTVVLRDTPLEKLFQSGEYRPPALEEAVGLCGALLRLFEGEGIPVIRLGLHHSGDLEKRRVAGPYHPAFRELCEGRLYLEEALAQIREQGLSGGKLTLWVASGAASKMAGHRRENTTKLAGMGFYPSIRQRDGMKRFTVIVQAE